MVMLTSGDYALGPATGSVFVHTGRHGLAAAAGHDLVIEVTRWTGQAHIEVGHPERSTVSAAFDVGSFEVRDGTGGVKPLTDADRVEIKSNIERKVLDAQRYPEISFATSDVRVAPPDIRLDGDLTIRGISRPITVHARLVDAAAVRFTGGATLVQTRWNITPYKGLFGTLRVADPVRVSFDLTARPEAY